LLTAEQVPLSRDVNVRTMFPVVVSFALGKYWAFRALAFGIKLPSPELDQVPSVVIPETVPFNVTDSVFAQILMSSPSLT